MRKLFFSDFNGLINGIDSDTRFITQSCRVAVSLFLVSLISLLFFCLRECCKILMDMNIDLSYLFFNVRKRQISDFV